MKEEVTPMRPVPTKFLSVIFFFFYLTSFIYGRIRLYFPDFDDNRSRALTVPYPSLDRGLDNDWGRMLFEFET